MKKIYVRLSKPLEFYEYKPNSINKPMGLLLAENVIDKNYKYNKLNVLTKKEVAEIKKKLRTYNK